MKILVLGLGNLLMNDDAAGLEIIYRLQKHYDLNKYPFLHFMDGGTLGLDIVPHLSDVTHLIIVDAVDLDLPPGTVVKIEGEDIHAVFENKLSPHQMGLKDILTAAELVDIKSEYVVMYGIQIKDINMDKEFSKEVENNLDKLENKVKEEIDSILKKFAQKL
ncbi:hydrogenase expression/formation protease [Deferribacter desulfuricans SSM1]|uniref:Hydrogenase expression/formation protease n=1 Tax=Deferribacter desulfuricans (strain DSM 14783 / JCM 11476 / NBRC 101012 / SSM1) TaxID=639282 RepID=D3PAG3_DEFDS|nr:HyaD/HybD family hydrogenase maturation endopeptidase [Deferribacter desulfuricans]BAI79586.1 hydrogenase expression/formation protease [Deferribacter desulfuricans SSM1]